MDKIATIIGNLLSIIFKYSATGWWYGKYWAVYRKWILNFLPNAAKTADIEPGLSMTIPENLHLEEHVHIGKKCVLVCFDEFRSEHGGGKPVIRIGDHSSLGNYSKISCAYKITLGKNVLTGRYCLITDNSHGAFTKEDLQKSPFDRPLAIKGEIKIDDNVWLGDRVTVCSGVHIGEGCVIAANAVVTHDIPPYSLAAGVPAKVVKHINIEDK